MTELDDPRRRLLEAAGEVFAEKGFEGATVRDICKRAKVNIAAINYYFRDKERLYIEAVKQAACGLPEAQNRVWPPNTPPAEKLRAFIRTMVAHFMVSNKPASAAVLMEILGEILPPDTPRWKRFMTGFSIVSQCLYYVQNKPIAKLLVGEEDFAWFDETRVAEHITAFSLAALGVTAQPSTNGMHTVR